MCLAYPLGKPSNCLVGSKALQKTSKHSMSGEQSDIYIYIHIYIYIYKHLSNGFSMSVLCFIQWTHVDANSFYDSRNILVIH